MTYMIRCIKCHELTTNFRPAPDEMQDSFEPRYVCDPECQRVEKSVTSARKYLTVVSMCALAIVSCILSSTPSAIQPEPTHNAKSNPLAVVNTDILNLRDCPRLVCAADANGLHAGDVLAIIHYGGWSYVKSPDGRVGWVNSDYIDVTQTQEESAK